jgi:hypothetical protein
MIVRLDPTDEVKLKHLFSSMPTLSDLYTRPPQDSYRRYPG